MTVRALNLAEADLRGGRFAGRDLRDADLRQSTLVRAELRGAQLSGARLRAADLGLADLRDADLRNTDLKDADLSGADLRGADLTGADLSGACWEWAWLGGVRGLPEPLAEARGVDGRVPGRATPADPDEPMQGLEALKRGKTAHAAGRLGLAERHLHDALAWVPESDVVRLHLEIGRAHV